MRTLTQIAPIAALVCATASFAAEALVMRPLFNGKDLSGWTGGGYIVEDGAIVCTPAGKNLMTEQTFSNYVLDFDFKLPPGGNNGLGVHYPGTGDGAYTGMEIQVLDNTAEKYKDLKEYQFHGSLYTLAPAKKSGLKPVGEWNHERVSVLGPAVTVELNGEIIQIAEVPPAANTEGVMAAGFTRFFNGKNLDGWKHGNSPEWTVSNGILKHSGRRGEPADLWTEKEYGDCTLVFDWRWSGRGPMKSQPTVMPDGSHKGKSEVEELDSGIYLRGSTKSQVNLWNWTVGSGEVYGYRTDPKMSAEVKAGVTPKTKADLPLGEWNRTMITLKGDRLSVSLNGRVVIENAQLPGVPAKGAIGLQHHGGAIDFANLWIKER